MTPHPGQLWLLPTVPRRLECGEHECCLCCGRGGEGTYGPPGLESIRLSDGAEHTVRLEDQWLCARHARLAWDEWRRCRALLPARLRRLAAFRHIEALGVRGLVERFTQAEALLRSGWQPEGVAA